jgi:hypothetical protein
VRPSELEISDEDLELFPSLRVKGEDDTQESAVLAPSEPAVAPGSEPAAESRADGLAGRSRRAGADDDLRLLQAASMLQNAEMRDDIADALLHFCGPLFKRRMLLTIQRESVVGWRGEGEGVDVTAVRAVAVPRDEPSVFKVL